VAWAGLLARPGRATRPFELVLVHWTWALEGPRPAVRGVNGL